MQEDFDRWNEVKKCTNAEKGRLYNVREIWWCRFGINVGTEINGKGNWYVRPGIILASFGRDACLIVPLTTSQREHRFRIPVGIILGKEAKANLSQVRTIDTRRLEQKIGFLNTDIFKNIRKAARHIF